MVGKTILTISNAFISKGIKLWYNIHAHDNTIKARQRLGKKLGNIRVAELFTAGNLET